MMKILMSKSFLKGYARVLNLGGTKEWPDLSEDRQRDYDALRSDWDNVGRAIRKQTRDFKRA